MSLCPSLLSVGLLLCSAACRPAVDATAATDALLEVDRSWAKLADAGADVDSIVAYWAPDARVILPGQSLLIGTDAIRRMVAGTRNVPGFHITWTPEAAVISSGGDLGYTYGTNRVTAPSSTGELVTTVGRYVAVWRMDLAGQWRCSIDVYNDGPAAPAPGA
jgi:ketosteroid isomerase-like protein